MRRYQSQQWTCTGSIWSAFTVNSSSLNVTGGGIVTADYLTNDGSIQIDGTGSTLTAYTLRSGNVSSDVTLTHGGQLVSRNAYIGYTEFESIVNIDGSGTLWTNDEDFGVGIETPGNTGQVADVNVTHGGQVSIAGGGLGGLGATGNLTVDGAGSKFAASGIFIVGTAGVGNLNIMAGGQVSDVNALVGRDAGSHGAVTVDGAGSTWTNSAAVTIGVAGTATLAITNGAKSTSASGAIGQSSSGDGVVTIDGTGSKWTVNDALHVGQSGQGSLSVTNGAQVACGSGFVGDMAGGRGAAVVDGVGSTWTVGSDLFVGDVGTATLTVRNGGAVSVGGTLTVGADGTLKGDGTISGNVSNGGHVSPGNSPGKLHIAGNYTQTASGALDIELAGVTSTQYDTLEASGLVALLGSINVSLAATFKPKAGNSFDIINWGTLTAESVVFNLPALPDSLSWNTTQFLSSGVISVVAAVPGDYNHNGVVDATDYTIWRGTLGSTTNLLADGNNNGMIDPGDYNVWKANFGNIAGPGGASSAPVPEPASALLSVLASFLLVFVRGRR